MPIESAKELAVWRLVRFLIRLGTGHEHVCPVRDGSQSDGIRLPLEVAAARAEASQINAPGQARAVLDYGLLRDALLH